MLILSPKNFQKHGLQRSDVKEAVLSILENCKVPKNPHVALKRKAK